MHDRFEEIQKLLQEIEKTEDAQIVYACESGSRAWGFASTDSDYDVRFIYVRRKDWYLSIDERRDVIERPINEQLDLSGWDIRKALKLLRKSNPPLLEWLQSPIVYCSHEASTRRLKEEIERCYNPTSCAYHYLHMARGNFREFLRKERVWLKKYFYVLRPVLACLWIEQGRGPVPMEFQKLVEEVLPQGELRLEVDKLLELKRAGAELDEGPRINVLNTFLEQEIERLEQSIPVHDRKADPTERLDRLFREILALLW